MSRPQRGVARLARGPGTVACIAASAALVAGCYDDSAPARQQPRFDTTFLDFGNVASGMSVERSFTLTNAGGDILQGTFGSTLCDPPSAPMGTPCWTLVGDGSYYLGSNDSKTFTVRFAPYTVSAGGGDCGIGASHCQVESAHGIVHCTATGLP